MLKNEYNHRSEVQPPNSKSSIAVEHTGLNHLPHCVERFGTTYGNGPWSCFPRDPKIFFFFFSNLIEGVVIFTSVSMDRDLSDLDMRDTFFSFSFFFSFFF